MAEFFDLKEFMDVIASIENSGAKAKLKGLA
jgi:hypothetical protein